MYQIEIAEVAALELTDAYNWYERQRPGLGGELLVEFEKVRRYLEERPLSYPATDEQTRRAPMRRFPYAVFFEIYEKRVVITAFFHSRRDPNRRIGQ